MALVVILCQKTNPVMISRKFSMASFRLFIVFCSLVLTPCLLQAAEETLVLGDGTTVKVLFFEPREAAELPQLAILVAGGSSNEFMARAQFWLGKELVDRGWAIAVPISPSGRRFFVENGQIFPEIIERLHASHKLKESKSLLVGISSGGSAALAIATQNPGADLGVVATPGRLWDESLITSLQGLPIYLRIGERDDFRWNRKLASMVDILHDAGARVDAAIVPDARHIFQLDWDDMEAWLTRLQQPEP